MPRAATRTCWRRSPKRRRPAGAQRIRFADTLGVLDPFATFERIATCVRAATSKSRCTPTTTSGWPPPIRWRRRRAGATHLNTTVNGLGERCGNAPLEEVVLGLHVCHGIATGIDLKGFPEISQRVASLRGALCAGRRALSAKAPSPTKQGIHVDGLLKDPANYQGFDPRLVGRATRVVLGKHSGARAVQQVMAGLGHELSDTSARAFLQRCEALRRREEASALDGRSPGPAGSRQPDDDANSSTPLQLAMADA
jgi:homocitrate synthase NifV